MTKTTTEPTTAPTEPKNPGLDSLAAQADALGAQAEAANVPPIDQAQAAADAAAQAAMEAGMHKLSFGLLRAVRSGIARNTPEIHQHWSDGDLSNTAAAIFPVANKYMARLMPMLGAYPEEAMLVMAALPLALGYVAAINAHDEKQAALQGGQPAAAAANVVSIDGHQPE